LWDLVRELESIAHGLQRIEWSAGADGLARGHHAHVDILLMGGLDLLLLLLQELNLLLDCKLFHCDTNTLALNFPDSTPWIFALWMQGLWIGNAVAPRLELAGDKGSHKREKKVVLKAK
jgi:hypothetical protein